MKTQPFQRSVQFVFWCVFVSMFAISCGKTALDPNKLSEKTPLHSIDTVKYQWDDLSTDRGATSDIITYDNAGKIGGVTSTNVAGLPATILFTYQGNKVTLNTAFKDEYDLDAAGRVILHIATHAEDPTFVFKNEEHYSY